MRDLTINLNAKEKACLTTHSSGWLIATADLDRYARYVGEKFKLRFVNKFKKKNLEHPRFAEGKSAFYNGLELSENPYGTETEFFSEWASGWHEACQTRKRVFEGQSKSIRSDSIDWSTVYPIGGFITGAISFIACWIYAIASWGFLLGVGLGWIPSLFIAVIAGFIWPLLALVLVAGLCVVAFLLYRN